MAVLKVGHNRTWVWGDKRLGYSVRPINTTKSRWVCETWLNNIRVRTDEDSSKEKVTTYANQRRRVYYGKETPARARAAHGIK